MSRKCLFCGSILELSVVPATIECWDCNQVNYFKSLASPKDMGQAGKYASSPPASQNWQADNSPRPHRGLIDMDPPDTYTGEVSDIYFGASVDETDSAENGIYHIVDPGNVSIPWVLERYAGEGLTKESCVDSGESSLVRRNLGLPYDMFRVDCDGDTLKVYEDTIYAGGATFRLEEPEGDGT